MKQQNSYTKPNKTCFLPSHIVTQVIYKVHPAQWPPDGEITTTFEYDGIQRLVKTPAERFHELVSRYPGVIHNLPIQEIASYLGISRRQLHRICEA